MELLWERMLAFYLELMMLIVPDEKRGVRQRRLAKGFAVCTALLCIGLVLGALFCLRRWIPRGGCFRWESAPVCR